MAAPTWEAAGAGAAIGSNPVSVPYPAGIVAGSLLIAQIANMDGNGLANTTPASPWAKLLEVIVSDGNGTYSVFVKRADGTESGNLSFAGSGTTGMYGRMYRFEGWFDNGTILDAFEGASIVNTAPGTTTVADVGVTTTGPDRLAVNLVSIRDDNSIPAFTGMTGGTWAEPIAEYTNTTGGVDACLQIQTATIASAGTINGGTATQSASDPFCVAGFAIKPAAAGAADPRPRDPYVLPSQAAHRSNRY